jgi:hypothetical protein
MDAGAAATTTRPGLWAVALLALLYGGAHLAWYWGTPLGRSPVLDERENLQLAAQIAQGTLPAEPFYRAMGYPLFLAGLRVTGLLTDQYPQAATGAGLLLHVLNTWLLALLARRWFGTARAGWIAGLLHGLNPVLIHYATQILDATLANTAVLAGLRALPVAGDDHGRDRRRALVLSLAWAAAALVRPQLVLLWLAFPLVWFAATDRTRLRRILAPAVLAGAALWIAQGLWSWHVGGEFRLLPWQGPYNLWAANHPGANGRYYTQTGLLPAGAPPENPARVESEALYRAATRDHGPLRIDVFNAYWRSRLRTEIAAEPVGWLALELRKAAYLLGNFEQYNNKTYAFHKERSPWLRPNPLGWGLLLLTGSLGVVALGRKSVPLLVTTAAVAAGVMLSYASARFRLPLTALLCGLAGGALAAPRRWWPDRLAGRAGIGLLLAGLAIVAYGGWFGGNSRVTYFQDHLLAGLAAERTGEDQTAWSEALAALAMRPGHPDAQRLLLSSGFNLLLRGAPLREATWREVAHRVGNPLGRPDTAVIGLALWRAGDPAGTVLWRQQADAESLAALALAGEATPAERDRLRSLPAQSPAGPFRALLAARESPEGDPNLKAAADRLFPRQ